MLYEVITINALHGDLRGRRNIKADALGCREVHGMGVTDVDHKACALCLRLVADADDLQLLFVAGGRAHNHVVDERAGQAMQRAMAFVVTGTFDVEYAGILLKDHLGRDFLAERALRTLYGDDVAVPDRNCSYNFV